MGEELKKLPSLEKEGWPPLRRTGWFVGKKLKLIVAVVLGCVLFLASCYQSQEPNVRMGQSISADLIVLFKPGTTREERASFDEKTIGKPAADSDGFGLMDGIKAELAFPSVCPNQDGIALTLRDDVTTEQLTAIRAAIDASPIVDKVFEDLSPKRIRCTTGSEK